MRFLTVIAALVFVGAASAQQTFTVVVGGNGTLTFNPPRLVMLEKIPGIHGTDQLNYYFQYQCISQ